MGVCSKVFAGFNHSFALLDQHKVRRKRIDTIDKIPAAEFRCEKSYSNSMKDLGEAEDMIPKDTIGWMIQNEHDEDLRDIKEFPEGEDDLMGTDLHRYSIPGSFSPFSL